jgi:hypothetical protein
MVARSKVDEGPIGGSEAVDDAETMELHHDKHPNACTLAASRFVENPAP